MTKHLQLLTLLSCVLLNPLLAQLSLPPSGQSLLEPEQNQQPQLQAALELVPQQGQPGAMLRLTLTPPAAHKWYYAAPGVGGLPPEFEWTLPAGWEVGEARYPLPSRFESFGLINWGYPQAATLEFPLTRLENAEAGAIQVNIDALICSAEACIPVQAQATLEDLPIEKIAQGKAQHPAPPELAVQWDQETNELKLILPQEHRTDKLLALLPVESAVDVAKAPSRSDLADSNPQLWQVPLAKQAGEPRPLEAWLIFEDQDGKRQADYVRLVPEA